MNSSTYYGLNLAEGSDIVNPLIIDVPNYEKIDEVMHDNATASVGLATELLTGTVHALVRSNDETAVFRFIATANFTAGDTFTVDGVQVTALLPTGEPLGTGAYVINANVLCILTGTLLTMYVPSGAVAVAEDSNKLGGELPSYYGTASDVNQANLVAQAAGTLANQVNSNLTDLSNLDYTETSVQSGTTTKELLQLLMNKVFPNAQYVTGTFRISTANPLTISVGTQIKTLRIVGKFDTDNFTFYYNSDNPSVTTRQSNGGAISTFTLPNTTHNTINSVGNDSFTMGIGLGYSTYGTLTYYVNEGL